MDIVSGDVTLDYEYGYHGSIFSYWRLAVLWSHSHEKVDEPDVGFETLGGLNLNRELIDLN